MSHPQTPHRRPTGAITGRRPSGHDINPPDEPGNRRHRLEDAQAAPQRHQGSTWHDMNPDVIQGSTRRGEPDILIQGSGSEPTTHARGEPKVKKPKLSLFKDNNPRTPGMPGGFGSGDPKAMNNPTHARGCPHHLPGILNITWTGEGKPLPILHPARLFFTNRTEDEQRKNINSGEIGTHKKEPETITAENNSKKEFCERTRENALNPKS